MPGLDLGPTLEKSKNIHVITSSYVGKSKHCAVVVDAWKLDDLGVNH